MVVVDFEIEYVNKWASNHPLNNLNDHNTVDIDSIESH